MSKHSVSEFSKRQMCLKHKWKTSTQVAENIFSIHKHFKTFRTLPPTQKQKKKNFLHDSHCSHCSLSLSLISLIALSILRDFFFAQVCSLSIFLFFSPA